MPLSRARTILSLVTATTAIASCGGASESSPAAPIASAPAPAAAPTPDPVIPAAAAGPLVAPNGRPACGNVLTKGPTPAPACPAAAPTVAGDVPR